MNDWRSTFDGANDHEADWEQAFVILEELPDGSTRPIWFAAAAHDEHGADLRRRWDDPELQKDGDHVIVFPGAGSTRRTWSGRVHHAAAAARRAAPPRSSTSSGRWRDT